MEPRVTLSWQQTNITLTNCYNLINMSLSTNNGVTANRTDLCTFNNVYSVNTDSQSSVPVFNNDSQSTVNSSNAVASTSWDYVEASNYLTDLTDINSLDLTQTWVYNQKNTFIPFISTNFINTDRYSIQSLANVAGETISPTVQRDLPLIKY